MTVVFFLFVSAIFGGISYKLQWLTATGSITASAFGFCLLWLGGWAWIVPLLVFFGSSSVLSKIAKRSLSSQGEKSKKDDIRNAVQVLANGGVAWMLLIAYAVSLNDIWYAGFVGSLAAANADTWATEIGRLADRQPRNILNGKVLEKGLSGGVTWQGTGGSLIGAVLIGLSCTFFSEYSVSYWVGLVVLSGMAGSLLDSVLGAAFQAKYAGNAGNEIVEDLELASSLTPISGLKWITNDVVNVLCTLMGGISALLFFGQVF